MIVSLFSDVRPEPQLAVDVVADSKWGAIGINSNMCFVAIAGWSRTVMMAARMKQLEATDAFESLRDTPTSCLHFVHTSAMAGAYSDGCRKAGQRQWIACYVQGKMDSRRMFMSRRKWMSRSAASGRCTVR
nr:hypothetical protein CFP56_02747 [Quercus suber]